jgi:formamidopyrimidine-DNA glycosylase
MPELPEVETIRLGLQKYLVGREIEEIDIRLVKMFYGKPESVIGARIIGVRRFGKGLVVDFGNGYSLGVHVKMTGQLVYRSSFAKARAGKRVSGVSRVSASSAAGARASKVDINNLPDGYTHVIFCLDNRGVLFYRDVRQFGWMRVVKTDEIANLPFFRDLGPEPFRDLTLEKFSGILKKTRMPIKSVLMDQRRIAGIGNIYANDALYLAGIDPRRVSLSLIDEEARRLFDAVESVLKKGLEVGGASEWNYVNVLGEKGEYQRFFQVYRREGEDCGRCGGVIRRMKLGGRGTFYCPGCQS